MEQLTAKQKQFCYEYLKDFNATQAAQRAGYSKKSAYEIGSQNLKKVEVRAFLDKLLEEHSLGKFETLKAISDIAKGKLNDYFRIVKVVRTPKVQVPLSHIILSIEQKIEDAEKLANRIEVDEDYLKSHAQQQQHRRREIIRLQIELERNPAATTLIDGEPELVEDAVLDMPALVRDEERGRIKSISYGEHGPKVEMYAADAALRDLLRVHGWFEKDNQQKQLIPVMSDEQFEKLRKEAREIATTASK